MSILVSVLLGYPKNSYTFWVNAVAKISIMYMANACEYYTEVYETNDGIVGVTESQISVILALLCFYFFENFSLQVKILGGIF